MVYWQCQVHHYSNAEAYSACKYKYTKYEQTHIYLNYWLLIDSYVKMAGNSDGLQWKKHPNTLQQMVNFVPLFYSKSILNKTRFQY